MRIDFGLNANEDSRIEHGLMVTNDDGSRTEGLFCYPFNTESDAWDVA